MTPRWYRITMFVFAVVWAALGVWSLADGDYARGAFDLALGVAWLLMAFFRDRLAATIPALSANKARGYSKTLQAKFISR